MEYLTVPILRLNGPGLFPGVATTIILKIDDEVREIIKCIRKKENNLGAFFAVDGTLPKSVLLPSETEIYPYGVLLKVLKATGIENDTFLQLRVMCADRIELLAKPSGVYGNIHMLPMFNELENNPEKEQAYKEIIRDTYAEYVLAVREMDRRFAGVKVLEEPINMVFPLSIIMGQVMSIMEYRPENTHAFLAANTLEGSYLICMDILRKAVEVKKIKSDLAAKVKANLSEKQKQVILNEEMNIIRSQMNDDKDDISEYESKLELLAASEAVKQKLTKEINKLKRMPSMSAETSVLMNYIENALDYPWMIASEENTSVVNAREVLDEDHYGLDKVKDRILEYLAVRGLSNNPMGTIMCLVGPPGTGKTSIVQSVARALGRKYVRICLGGVHDESEIRGHRKTYVGAMPGRIVNAIKNAGVNNPVILLDEIDKLGRDMRGDPADALLEVLDSEQNYAFRDHYMELPIDLSKVMFIATANDRSRIPEALHDRLDIIEINSYTPLEKMHIAEKYLVSKEMDKNGLKEGQLSISRDAINAIIEKYTKEAGVRELDRKIAAICRKAALKLVEDSEQVIEVEDDKLEEYLGKPLHKSDEHNHEAKVGVVHGLAWTSVGGVVLDVEAAAMSGNGELVLTGKMGDVMKESARIAASLVRAKTMDCGLEEDYYQKHSFHIHIPEGAVPKDGPSAGITLSTAIYSVVKGIKVRGDVAMTGEVTLTGRVLAIGGLKEKLLAAKLAGYTVGIVPLANKMDVEELSDEIIDGMQIIYVSDIDEVWQHVLC